MSFHRTSITTRATFVGLCVCALSGPSNAEQASHAHLLGGTAALVGGGDLDQREARPISVAEVAFVSELLARGLGNTSVDGAFSEKKLFVSARRVAVLLRLLAQKARLLGEKPKSEDVRLARYAVAHRLGGEDQVNALLARLGIGPKSYIDFLADLTLAKAQLAYVVDSAGVLAGPGLTPREEFDPSAVEALRQLSDAAVQEGQLRVLP
jgi:hypothetical protein